MIKSENVRNIYDFISATHPQINESYEEGVELRVLGRDKEHSYNLRSLIFYNSNEKQLEALEKQVEKLNSLEKPFCFYYSVYSFNPEGKRINKKNAQRTQILCADFDHIDQNEFDVILEDLKKKGLEPNYSIFSGHGFQIVYLLKEASANKELLNDFTLAMLENGYPVDEKIKDCARVMRLPFTYNSKNPEQPIETYIYSKKSEAYDLNDIWRKLGVKEPEQTEDNQRTTKGQPTPKETPDNQFFDDSILLQIYADTRLNIRKLPEPIKSMLMGFRNGKSSDMTKSLVLYFRDYEGMTQKEVLKVFRAMENINTFNYTGDRWNTIEKEVKNLYQNRNYKFNYNSVKEFGNIDTLYKFKKNDTTIIYNDLFDAETYDSKKKEYKPISNIAFVIYLRLTCNQTITGVKAYTMEDIEKICNKTRQAMTSKIKELCDAGLIDKKRADRKNGEKYAYILNGLKVKEQKGFTKLNNVVLQSMLKCLDEGELNETCVKFLLYMKKVIECSGAEEIEIDQQSIAKALNISRTGVVKMWKKLEECKIKFVSREANWIQTDGSGKTSYSYNVNF